MIPVPLKIIKLLVLELGPTLGGGVDSSRMYPGNSQLPDSEGSDDDAGDWEEVPSGLIVPGLSNEGLYTLRLLPIGTRKWSGAYATPELLALGGGSGRHSRQTDDETYVRHEVVSICGLMLTGQKIPKAYLTNFFREISAANIGGFQGLYAALKPEEQMPLNQLFS